MQEAKKRNPNISLGILEWGAPGWMGALADPNADWATAGRMKYYTQDNADYIVAFIKAARDQHGLKIDYTGIWNENNFDAEWIKLLRQTLDRNGLLSVKIVAADLNNESRIAEAMMKDPELLKDVDIIGVHYPERHLSPEPAALQTGKTIWASEDGFSDIWNGRRFPYMIRAYIRNYIDSRMTSTIIWSVVTAYYDWTRYPNSGPLRAVEPWSGHYEVQDGVWFTAHMTQFIRPGWRFLDHACALLPGKGSYVSLVAPGGGDYSMIFETIGASAPQQVTVHLASGLSQQPLHVWTSDANTRFVHQPDLRPSGDNFSLTLPPDTILSLSTQGGQQKGAASDMPPGQPFPLPYHDDFESYRPGKLAKYFSDQTGSFAVAQRADGQGNCYRQVVPQPGIDWHYPNWEPTTFLGDVDWKNYSVACDARIEDHGAVVLYGHVLKAITVVKGKEAVAAPPPGCWLRVDESGHWQIVSYDKKKEDHQLILASGTCAFSANTWHHLEIDFQGDLITAKIDGSTLGSAKTANLNGAVGLGSGSPAPRASALWRWPPAWRGQPSCWAGMPASSAWARVHLAATR